MWNLLLLIRAISNSWDTNSLDACKHHPNVAMKLDYLKFSESRATVSYVHTMKSSSTSIGFSVSGFYGRFVGEVQGAYSSQKESDKTRSVKSHSTSASVVQFIWNAKKCFRIEQEDVMLSRSAPRKAKAIANEDDAHRFKKIFLESHSCWYSDPWRRLFQCCRGRK